MTASYISFVHIRYYRDLTSTFEALIQQREESFGLRERDIGFQVGSLDKKFEQLQTENSRLKAENMEANRKVDALSDESSAKEEHLRQLQWRLDDERNSKQQGDDLGHRKVHQLSLDLVAAKDKAAQDLSDLSKSLEKVNLADADACSDSFTLSAEKAITSAVHLVYTS